MPDPNDDSIDYALGFAQMIEALLPYWQRQESMPPEQAIRKLISEHEVYHSVLSDMADGVDAMEPYGEWAARVIGVATPASTATAGLVGHGTCDECGTCHACGENPPDCPTIALPSTGPQEC